MAFQNQSCDSYGQKEFALQMVVHVVQWLKDELPELYERISSRARKNLREGKTYHAMHRPKEAPLVITSS
jgi:hypothetical protein